MAAARSTDGGNTWPLLTQFSFESGENHFNDKPMMTVDINQTSPARDNVYVAWDAAIGGSTSGGIRVAHSTDHGATFAVSRADTPSGPGNSIGAVPFDIGIPAESFRRALVYPACDTDRSKSSFRGRLYCSWMDLNGVNTDILLSFSDDAGSSWSAPAPVGHQLAGTDRFNHWLSVDPTSGDVTVSYYDTQNDATGHRFMTDIFLSRSTNGGAT